MNKSIIAFVIAAIALLNSARAETIQLEQQNGIFMVRVKINNAVIIPFVIDSGAAEVAIPLDVFMTLVRAKTISDADDMGKGNYIQADGSSVTDERYMIHSMVIGKHTINNVVASVANIKGEPLLGQSFLSRLPSWTFDNNQHALVLNDDAGAIASAEPPRQPIPERIPEHTAEQSPNANCGGNANAQITLPIMRLYDAVNRKDLDLYSQQLASDLTYYNQSSHITQNRDQKIDSKKRSFDRIDQFRLTMDKNPEIVTKTSDSAVVEVRYSMTYMAHEQPPVTQSNILERYTVVCAQSGQWLISGNVDEISSAGPAHR